MVRQDEKAKCTSHDAADYIDASQKSKDSDMSMPMRRWLELFLSFKMYSTSAWLYMTPIHMVRGNVQLSWRKKRRPCYMHLGQTLNPFIDTRTSRTIAHYKWHNISISVIYGEEKRSHNDADCLRHTRNSTTIIQNHTDSRPRELKKIITHFIGHRFRRWTLRNVIN